MYGLKEQTHRAFFRPARSTKRNIRSRSTVGKSVNEAMMHLTFRVIAIVVLMKMELECVLPRS